MNSIIKPIISTVMVSYLHDYPGSRSKPILKFNRAVQSWVNQTFQSKELIIVSDGCELTKQEYHQNWAQYENIRLIEMPKSIDPWPGKYRQLGVDHAYGEWITYLDSDDLYLVDYLERIAEQIQRFPTQKYMVNEAIAQVIPAWQPVSQSIVKLNIVGKPVRLFKSRSEHPQRIPDTNLYWAARRANSTRWATHTLIHQREIDEKWPEGNETGEDLRFSDQWLDPHKIYEPGYIICHLHDNVLDE
jgi:glycosyltransferase involved in cell wall biosynthesis